MAKKPQQTLLAEQIQQALKHIEAISTTLTKPAAKRTYELLAAIKVDVDRATAALDPVKEPLSWFDPSDPNTAGRLVAAALLAQPRVPLAYVPRSYGSGVYAIYYNGSHSLYAPISKSETPIYVGKADPNGTMAKTPRQQGVRLYGRLADHRKMIRAAETHGISLGRSELLRLEDFDCRRLVTATNAQLFAERHLITIFRPIWNKETNICWGISKHGDTEGRSNSRSPWDVLHPGRAWAMATKLEDSRPASQIKADVAQHLKAYPAYKDRRFIIDLFLNEFIQDPMIAAKPVTDDVETEAEAEEAPEN